MNKPTTVLSPLLASDMRAAEQAPDWFADDDVEECAAAAAPVDSTCPVCKFAARDVYAAADCCLWHDLGLAHRYRIAEAVRRGSSWADAIKEVAP